MTYETLIGLEVHAQLLTRGKMFCGCNADYASAPPNTHVCPVCLGMPGVLPTINRRAVEYAVMTALALNCSISPRTRFDRKNYPYPDLMKGYQISQYDAPLSHDGWTYIEVDGGEKKRVGVTRVHLEEDVAKLLHRADPSGETYSLMDVNRSGVSLMEVVSEPDMRSPEEARQYLVKLRSILQYLGVSTGNMEEGSFRCDANVSIRPAGSDKLLAKVEIKNMNSFKAVYRALQYEVERQRGVLETGDKLVQETRGWVEEEGVTVSQRSKEYAHDYRYFPEPDLPPMNLERAWVEELEGRLPELPDERRDRFIASYGLSSYEATLLTSTRAMADFYEACLEREREKEVSNWMLGEFSRLLNAADADIGGSRITPKHLVGLLDLVEAGTLSTSLAKQVFEEMFSSGKHAGEVVAEKGLSQISDASELSQVISRVLADNARAVADFKGGKEGALTFLVGQVMKATRGQANPGLVNTLLRKELE
ncbi:Asp-tRNA(Asn)/Glu-tRNA(Gln) amidotransferase subunit GatB [Chloroflexota bacterium]